MSARGSLMRAAWLCFAPLAVATNSRSAELAPPPDGWASWEVAAVDDAPAWCCRSGWDSHDTTLKTCKLDDEHLNFGGRDEQRTSAMRVYARLSGGKVERLRALSADCPVEAATPIKDLGTVAADDSARWLAALAKANTETGHWADMRESTMGALAVHRGDVAQNTLATIARGDSRFDLRRSAVFWLAMVRGAAGAEVATSVMFTDTNPGMREHAAFAVSQSQSTNKVRDLTRLGNDDENAEVRSKAWFWLAQTRAPGAEEPIRAALRTDKSEHVREQAVFALSRLPEERATPALIAVAQDQSLTREQRKRALFWLGQSGSQSAQAYLEKVLMGNSGR